MRFTLQGAHLVDATMDVERGSVVVDGTQIQAVGQDDGAEGLRIDASDSIILPGFIEVHTHGGGGFNLHTTDVEEVRSYRRWIPTTGVTSFLVTVVGTPNALPEAQLQTAVAAIEQAHQNSSEPSAEPIGIFLEGPYISVKKRGAHPPIWLRIPDEKETERILKLTRGYLRLLTIAPELPGAHDMIRRLVEEGVTVSIGHTDSDYEQAREAIQLGITHATHCFNAMRQLEHRDPGPLAAIVQAEQVLGELIGDGVHVHPAMMDMLVRMLGSQRTVVVTDALAGAGMTDATFEFAGQQARVICGAARLEDGTLTGSVLTMDQALRNMLDMTPISLSDASGMLSLNPARSAQVKDRKALLRAGYDADLVIYDRSLQLQATICRGQVCYATDAWRQRLSLDTIKEA
ncbi:N-acetylglucosamine-6-phosphate deacetylase [Dictyobacter aurantiacus]|uniref:N-acetylglucosamine-6-phosphate deacetylase n=1 Tax=Dictyobacter aurantiacus TaxID=1936993 RepID=A0A401ZEF9_9CHLR|nr:N-acetylglucosamine-6-phosphate deacetylase [Dictyobacter aurantiacus]GCE05257.1 N-acetylglucosamine-6-phosphate deacetylase [Dictyobacter aurantiacus]